MFVGGPYVAHFAMLSARGAASPLGCYSILPRASCVPIGKDQERAAEYLRTHSQGGEPSLSVPRATTGSSLTTC